MNTNKKLPLITVIEKHDAQLFKKALTRVWQLECRSLNIALNHPDNLVQLVDALFDPKKKLSAIMNRVKSLPDLEGIVSEFDHWGLSPKDLEAQGFLRIIHTRTTEKITMTPEGLIFLGLLDTAHSSGDYYYLNPDLLAQRLADLLSLYSTKMSSQLSRLEKSHREKLSMAEVGLLLFFLINGSIGEEYPCNNVDTETAQTIETIVRAYTRDSKGKRNEFHWRGWYLTEANRKLGGVIVNQEPIYYLKSDTASIVEDEICARVTEDGDSYSFFINGWQKLNEAYQKGRPLLEKHYIAHFSQSRVDSLFNRIKHKAKEKGL